MAISLIYTLITYIAVGYTLIKLHSTGINVNALHNEWQCI